MTVGAIAVAVVSAGIGGAAASVIEHHGQLTATADGALPGGATPGMPAANAPAGSVEAIAAKVVPSVVMLETNIGRQSEEGSGIVLSADGLILTNNHVVATAAGKPPSPRDREQRPDDDTGLAAIPGIGATKRERYGAQVLAVLGGEDPQTVAAQAVAVP